MKETKRQINFVVNGEEKVYVLENESFSFAVLGNSTITINLPREELMIPMRVLISDSVNIIKE